MYFNHKYSNNNCNNMLYFMLGATTTVMSCMGYCLCKNQKCEASEQNSHTNHHNNDVSNLVKNMHKQMCRNNHKSKCHAKHRMHSRVSYNENVVKNNESNENLNNTFE